MTTVSRVKLSLLGIVLLEFTLFFLWTPARLSDDDLFQGEGVPADAIRFANRLNEPQPWPWFYAIAVLGAVYGCRTCICAVAHDSKTAWSWYWILSAATLPIIWLLIAPDWYNEQATALAYWVGTPLQLLAIPTFGMFLLNTEPPFKKAGMIAWCAFELLVLLPLWTMAVYPLLAFTVLGFYGI